MRVCSDGIITELWSTQGECGVRKTVWMRVYIFLYVECGTVQESNFEGVEVTMKDNVEDSVYY